MVKLRSLSMLVVCASCFEPELTGSSSETDSTSAGTGDPSSDSTASTSSMSTSGMTDNPSTSMPTSTTATTNTTDDETTTTTTDDPACAGDEVCVPEIPADWMGPFAIESSCPAAYPDAAVVLNEDFIEGVYQCDCNCSVGNVGCSLYLENEGVEFDPQGSCDSPPFNDECLSAVVEASCIDNAVDMPGEPAWNNTTTACGGGTQGAACTGGTCFFDPGSSLCIARDGDEECPAEFPDRTLYHRSFMDTRTCSACDCSPSGQACTIDVEICSLGFDQVELLTGGGCYQLNSSDGDGVTLLNAGVSNQGSCTPNNGTGELSGEAAPTDPVTVCCLD